MNDQLPLFDQPELDPAPPRARSTPRPSPAHVLPAIARIAAALPASVHLGTSSWAFPGWAGVVYRDALAETVLARDGLAAYGAHPLLRTVGIDRSFYASLDADVYAGYAAQVPAQFRFMAKAPAAVCDAHRREARGKPSGENPSFLDPRLAIDTFVGPALAGLGRRAGPLVFQLSPMAGSRRPGAAPWAIDRIGRFLAAIHAEYPDALLALEPRDPDLVRPALADALAAAGARYCFSVHPRMPSLAEQTDALAPRLGRGALVVRWNLHGGYAYEAAKARYAPFDRIVEADPSSRASIAALVHDAVEANQQSFVVVNNKAEGSAPCSVIALAEAIANRRDSNRLSE